MPDAFDSYTLKEKEQLVWQKCPGDAWIAETTRGIYRIVGKQLFFAPLRGVSTRLGVYKDPRRAARKHYNEVA